MWSDILTLYCLCMDWKGPRHSQYNQKNLICNAASLSEERKTQLTFSNFLLDDTEKNISYLNHTFGDLTGLYWVWKNTSDEFVGVNQYRRFWCENEVNSIIPDNNIVYIGGPFYPGCSALDMHIRWHGNLAINTLRSLTKNPDYIFRSKDIDYLGKIYAQSQCNMFFCHRYLFDKLCSVLFEIIFDVFRISFEDIGKLPPRQRRIIAFLFELIITSVVEHGDYYLGSKGFQYVQYYVVE